jgi:O-6-methylguanine DNA methyltransferase
MTATFRFPLNVPAEHGPRQTLWQAVFSEHGLRELSLLPVASGPLTAITDRRARNLLKKIAARMAGKRADIGWDELDLSGRAPFHLRVWQALHRIPLGKTVTYAEVAAAAGSPNAFRACGQACGANPILLFIPCHRVVAASGLGGFSGGLDIKRALLRLEGIDWQTRSKKARVV